MVEHLAAHGLGLQPVVAMADRLVGFDDGVFKRGDGVGVNLVCNVPEGGWRRVLAPAVLNLLFERQGVQAKGQGRGSLGERLGEALGGLFSPRTVWIRQSI